MSYQDDDSKTFDNSVLIHDLEAVPDDIEVASQSVPVPIIRAPSSSIDTNRLTPTSTVPNKVKHGPHGRNISVGNMIPSRYLNQAPSLIALLDAQRSKRKGGLQAPNLIISKSMPDLSNKDLQPSPSYQSDDDFDDTPQGVLHDSDDNVVTLNFKHRVESIEDDDLPLEEPELEAMTSFKQQEYESLARANTTQNKDDMVDLQLLAAKAAEEFTVLANDNDKLQRENERLKEKYDDVMHDQEVMVTELSSLKNKQNDHKKYIDQIDVLHSKSEKWQLEKKMLIEQLAEYKESKVHNGLSKDKGSGDDLMGKTGLKLRHRQSEDAERLMMESLAKITREKNVLEDEMFKEKETKREYEMTIASLKKELLNEEAERQRLSDNLDKQQHLYYSLKENAKKKELEIDHIVGLTQDEALQEEEEAEKLYQEMDEQKAYIEQLEAENEQLIQSKIKSDDEMFQELKAIRVHRFQPSMQFGGDNMPVFNEDKGNHSRAQSQSLSNYSQSGLFFAPRSDGELLNKTLRTQITLFGLDDYNNDGREQEDIMDLKDIDKDKSGDIDMDTPQPTEKKVVFKPPTDKDKKKKKQREEMFKVNAEIEFFLLTAIAVKANLVEEYPDKPEVITEDAMKLFEIAQKEKVVMSKFNLWIEMKLREKYDLPKLEGFQKFMEKHDVKGKMDKLGKNIAAAGVKSGKFAKQTGKIIKQQTIQISERVRALSKKADDREDNEDIKDRTTDEATPNWLKQKTEEIGTRIRGLSKKNDDREEDTNGDDNDNKDDDKDHDNDTKKKRNNVFNDNDTNLSENKDGNDNAVDNKNNKQCRCIVM